MATVEPPISMSEATRVDLRPTRSPKWPNTAAPRGRAMKATARVASADSCWLAGEMLGKNIGPNTREAAVA